MAFFAFFGCFCPYVRQPHDHIGWATSMPFASINPTNPRTNLWNFREKILRIGDFEKRCFFESAILNFFFRKKNFFFAFFAWKQVKVYWLARMGQNFDQGKRDSTFWPRQNILKGSVSTRSSINTWLFTEIDVFKKQNKKCGFCWYSQTWQ